MSNRKIAKIQALMFSLFTRYSKAGYGSDKEIKVSTKYGKCINKNTQEEYNRHLVKVNKWLYHK